MNIPDIIDTVRKQNFVTRMQNELIYLKGDEQTLGLTDKAVGERIELLEIILNENKPKMVQVEEGAPKINTKVDEICKTLNEHAYKKLWSKLIPIHRIIKIKEFVKEQYGEGEYIDNMLVDLLNYVNDGKLDKKYVVYDNKVGKIVSISCLHVDTESEKYKFKF